MLKWYMLIFLAMTHDPRIIKAIDTVRAYHSGPRIITEVDVVIDGDETVQVAHDVAEELQQKLESLPNVERAYVHIDYETFHKPEHNLKKVL
jgi:divalent metal cation (Fe/Co/Zn/Cd) transporter